MKAPRPDGPELDRLIREAVALHRGGQPARADAIYRRVLRSAPDHPDALHFSGLLAHQRGDEETAIERIEKAIRCKPDYADAIKNLGNIQMGRDAFTEAEACYLRAIELQPDDPSTWSNLGIARRYQRRFAEAIAAGEKAVRMAPEHEGLWYNLGNSYKVDRNYRQAIRCYEKAVTLNPKLAPAHDALCQSTLMLERKSWLGGRSLRRTRRAYERWLACEPDNPIANFMLRAVNGEKGLARAPDAVIRGMFDQFAPNFERRLAQLEYRAPQLVASVVARQLGEASGNLSVLDGGCGTGLCAPALRPYAGQLTGVDLSAGMLARARKTGLYDTLVEDELTGFLLRNPAGFDLAVFADTLCYFGDLSPVLSAAGDALRPGGLLVFTTERTPDGPRSGDYVLHPHGRYSHSESYIGRVLEGYGFVGIECRHDTLRLEIARPVAGLVVSARRPG